MLLLLHYVIFIVNEARCALAIKYILTLAISSNVIDINLIEYCNTVI